MGGCGSSSPPGTAHPAAPHDQIWRRWRGGRLAAGCGSTARPGAVLQHPLAGQRPWLAATGAALALGDASLPASRQAELSPCRPTAHTRLPAWLPTLAAPPACPVLPALCCLRCLPDCLPHSLSLQLLELNLESSEGPLNFESATCLPPSLSKIFAVESHMAEVPGGHAELKAS